MSDHRPRLIRLFCLSFFLQFFIFAGNILAVENVVTITMPSDLLHQTLSDALPIPIETKNKHVAGDIFIESIDTLQIEDNLLSLQGVIIGTNLSMSTSIGGQEIKAKIGQVRLPVTCEIGLSFDPGQKMLFITPRFPDQGTKGKADPANVVQPLLDGLTQESYPVLLDSRQPFFARIGKRDIPVSMETVDIQAVKDTLIIKLRPKVNK